MGGTTPTMGIPYPTGTDRVMDGDNAMQALAERVDTVGLFRHAGSAGTAVELNQIIVTTDSNGGAIIPFPTAFSVTPVIFLTSGDQGGTVAEVVADSSYTNATQFTVQVRFTTNGALAANNTIRLNWLAIGPK